uniref:Glycosyltransferase AglD n=1 Tax=Candidatus Methanogaster sp. ANME-2c ERB4 TaxID=2759911 RepID=A0A7G9Y0Z4_9EURY|nr:glycosyltransferase AglD [Methanosarcinales archaeon ANME-2c ERB4]QNO41678.1 glycosyltransferase AglD [Methanosarcinales archaeon ANME-2c ERB4]QNO48385.1 glycosyltransferase AglD [Methanosarcinales archaeon ANME-2c ERB4]
METADVLGKITSSFEIIIAEDGATDGTEKIAESLASEYPYVVHLHSDERLGRGTALNRAFKSAHGDILVYIDVDLATDMSHLSELINQIRSGYDLATGSRMMPESDAVRSAKRGIASKGFNFLVRTMLGSKLYDHQCGFKAFKRSVLLDLLDQVRDEHWFWDTEILVRAERAGYRVAEFPIKWRPGSSTKVDMKRDVVGMGLAILRLRLEFGFR